MVLSAILKAWLQEYLLTWKSQVCEQGRQLKQMFIVLFYTESLPQLITYITSILEQYYWLAANSSSNRVGVIGLC